MGSGIRALDLGEELLGMATNLNCSLGAHMLCYTKIIFKRKWKKYIYINLYLVFDYMPYDVFVQLYLLFVSNHDHIASMLQ